MALYQVWITKEIEVYVEAESPEEAIFQADPKKQDWVNESNTTHYECEGLEATEPLVYG